MVESSFRLLASDGAALNVNRWIPDAAPKGILFISHGMGEHGARYAALAQSLEVDDWVVYASDHRGHGRTATETQDLGYLGDGIGWPHLVEDLRLVAQRAAEDYPGLPIFLYGHSFGTLIAQAFIAHHGALLAGCALSGMPTPLEPGLKIAGKAVVSLGMLFKGPRGKANLIKGMTFGQYNKAFAPNRTECDWLTRDEKIVDRYLADPFCAFTCSYSFYRETDSCLDYVYGSDSLDGVPKNLPLYFFCGQKDQVIGSVPAFNAVVQRYRKLGIADIESRIHEGARHEVVNETSREQVIKELRAWLFARRSESAKA